MAVAARPSTVLFALLTLLLFGGGLAASHFTHGQPAAARRLVSERAAVQRFGLTDLCLATEATYTRNPALADRFAAFQNHPSAIEHFPSGTIILPPPHIKDTHAARH